MIDTMRVVEDDVAPPLPSPIEPETGSVDEIVASRLGIVIAGENAAVHPAMYNKDSAACRDVNDVIVMPWFPTKVRSDGRKWKLGLDDVQWQPTDDGLFSQFNILGMVWYSSCAYNDVDSLHEKKM
jgi:hypothetical protein